MMSVIDSVDVGRRSQIHRCRGRMHLVGWDGTGYIQILGACYQGTVVHVQLPESEPEIFSGLVRTASGAACGADGR